MDLSLILVILIAGLVVKLGLDVNYAFTCTAVDTLTGNTDAVKPADLTKTHTLDQFDEAGTLTGATTPAVTKHAYFKLALTSGAGSIDLTALKSLNGATIDGTGLKVQVIRVKPLGANKMTFSEGASDGYAIDDFTAYPTSGSVPGVTQILAPESLPDVSSANKIIDVVGTGAQEAEVTIILG